MSEFVDNYVLAAIHIGIIFGVVAQMNHMHITKSSKVEAAAWWCVGMGAFSELVFTLDNAHKYAGWAETLFAFGTLFLILLIIQPHWRPYIAERRKDHERRNQMRATSQ